MLIPVFEVIDANERANDRTKECMNESMTLISHHELLFGELLPWRETQHVARLMNNG